MERIFKKLLVLLLFNIVLLLFTKTTNAAHHKSKKVKHIQQKHGYIRSMTKKDDIEEDGANCDANDANFQNTWAFNDLLKKDILDIKDTRFCRFSRQADGCVHKFKQVCGRCPLYQFMKQLFDRVDIFAATQTMIVPRKNQIKYFEVSECNGLKVTITIRNHEEESLACNYLQLRPGGTFTVSWTKNHFPTLEEMEISGGGEVNDGTYAVQLKKFIGNDFVNVTVEPQNQASVSCAGFVKLFGVNFNEILGDDYKKMYNTLQMDGLSFENPEGKGLIFPGQSYEFFLFGNFEANPILSGQTSSFIVAQYFKEDSEGVPSKQIVPKVAMYVPYSGSNLRAKIESITGFQLPPLTLVKDISSFVFCITTKPMFMLFDDKLRQIAEKLKSPNEQGFASTGPTFMFKKKDLQKKLSHVRQRATIGEPPSEAKFTVTVNKNDLVIDTLEQLENTFQQLTDLMWDRGLPAFERVKHSMEGQVLFNSIVYKEEAALASISITANLTANLQVNGPFYVNNITLEYFANKNPEGDYEPWRFNASGKSIFMQEETNITVEEKPDKSYMIKSTTEVFSMAELLNQTGGTYLRKKLEPYYEHTLDYTMSDMVTHGHMGASDGVLRIKGKIILPEAGENNIEVLYWIDQSKPNVLLGIAFYNVRFDKVVNSIFGDNQFSQTWMTFDRIGIVFIKDDHSKDFEEDILTRVPKTAGIHIATSGLQLTKFKSNDTYKAMAYFLKARFGDYMDLNYMGNFGVNQDKETKEMIRSFSVSADIQGTVCAESLLQFEELQSEVKSIAKGEFGRIRCVLNFKRHGIKVPGVIYVDGSGSLQIKTASTGSDIETTKLFELDYLKLVPLKVHMGVSPYYCPRYIAFTSGMTIGTNSDALIRFPWRKSEQSVNTESERSSSFLGTTQAIKFVDILDAFKLTGRLHYLNNAKCMEQLVVAYSGGLRRVWIPDLDRKISEGLNFFCDLRIPHGPVLETHCTMMASDQMKCKMNFVKPIVSSNKNFRMSFSSTNDSFGPLLLTTFNGDSMSAKLRGFVSLPGLEQDVSFSITNRDPTGDGTSTHFEAVFRGKIYDELPALIQLTGNSDDIRNVAFNMDVKFETSLTFTTKDKIKAKIESYYTLYSEARKRAKESLTELDTKLQEYTSKRDKMAAKVNSKERQIKATSHDVEDASLSLAKDCLDECTTITLPSLKLDEECSSTTSSNARCYRWADDEVKAIDVMELVKCQAKKISTYLATKKNVASIEFLMKDLIKSKAKLVNLEIFVDQYNKMKEIAEDTNRIIEERLSTCSDLEEIHKEYAGYWFNLKEPLTSNGKLSDISPPAYPVQAKWTLNEKEYQGTLNVSFMFPFEESLAEKILSASFGTNEVVTAVNEANLRYQQQKNLQNELKTHIENQKPKSEGAAKRSIMKTSGHKEILKRATPSISQFSILSDSSLRGYRQLSPWARIPKGQSLAAKRDVVSSPHAANWTSQGGEENSCLAAEHVYKWYHDVTDSLKGMLDNYDHGKLLISRSREKLYNKLSEAEQYISKEVNDSGAVDSDKDTMMYWLYPIKSGLQFWDTYHFGQLDKQNRKFIPMLKEELDQSAKANNFANVLGYIDYLGNQWNSAQRRGSVKTSGHNNTNAAQYLLQTMKDLFSNPTTLENAKPKIDGLHYYVKQTKLNLRSCN